MARSRILKPEFFLNDDLLELPPLTRLLYAGLWTQADRDGRLEDRPKKLKLALFPGDDCDVDQMLDALAGKGLVVRYEVRGTRYLAIPTFGKHQSPHVSEKSREIPPPPTKVAAVDKHDVSTVQAPDKHGANTEQAGIFPPHSDSDSDSSSDSGSESAPSAQSPTGDAPTGLLALVDGWNALGKSITAHQVTRDPVPRAVLAGWRKAQQDPDLKAAFSDVPKLLATVRKARFCHGEPWFSLAWLFGKNKSGEYVAVKLLNGGFESHGKPTTDAIGPGQRHDPQQELGTFYGDDRPIQRSA